MSKDLKELIEIYYNDYTGHTHQHRLPSKDVLLQNLVDKGKF